MSFNSSNLKSLLPQEPSIEIRFGKCLKTTGYINITKVNKKNFLSAISFIFVDDPF